MYLITSTFNMGLGENDFKIEKELIAIYCDQLQVHGITYDKSKALRDFKIVMLDMARVILAYFYAGATPQSIVKAASDPGEVAYCCYIPNFIDMVRYLDQLLEEYENNI